MGEIDTLKKSLQNSFQNIKEDMDSLRQEISKLRKELGDVKKENVNLKQKISEKPLEKEVMNTLNRNKKAIIKNKILELIEEQRHSIPEIKDIIVDQQRYCSKASFYRYIEEIKAKNEFKELEVNEKVVLIR